MLLYSMLYIKDLNNMFYLCYYITDYIMHLHLLLFKLLNRMLCNNAIFYDIKHAISHQV